MSVYRNGFIATTAACVALGVGGVAWGQAGGSGISNDRVSLPGGPGSLEGVGENIAINGNMGQMSHSVPISVPEGYAGMTPHVALSYSSGNGSSVVGMGWSMDFPYIERMTVRGLPRYVREDRFTADGSDQLVLIPGADAPVYRARYEREFVRYTWQNAGDGKEGYWTAEHPDGKVAYYGADATGALVPSARVAGTGGTYRYHLVDMTDRYGHKIHYDYAKVGNVTLAQHIGWAHAGEGGKALYEVTFEYASRSDKLSDCKPGFNELLEVRLATVNVFSRSQKIRQYQLTYEAYGTSGGFSRLAGVQTYGLGGKQYPVHETFEYSHTLGAVCSPGDPCKKPYAAEMGSLGVDFGAGHTTLIDINGDSLPDVIDSSQAGGHRLWLNVLMPDGTHKFVGPSVSAVGTKSSHDLGSPNVQVIDVNGDGFTDMVNRKTGQVLVNLGGGDWVRMESIFASCGDTCLPDMEGDFNPQDGELNTIRFLDYDNDKRIDVLKSMGSGAANVTMVYRNNGSGGFTKDDSVDAIGAGFEDDRLELDDMNGDGLLDAIQVAQNSLRYRLSLGWGKWAPWVEIAGFTFTDQEAVQADLEDLNGDGLADLTLVAGNKVRYWLNRNGASFDAERSITTADLERGVIPERTSAVKVLYADMNGNGSHDIVWVNSNGQVTYLELFPVRPNLLSRIKNGLGKVTDVTYRPSVEFQADDGGRTGWKYPLPTPMNLVSRSDDWDELTQVHQIVNYTYHDGFYDGAEKQFRGYERVEDVQPADENNEEGKRLQVYEVGANDPYYFGLLLTREMQGLGGRSLQLSTNEYAECRLTGVPTTGLDFPVRHVCLESETTEQREGVEPSQWTKTRSEFTYDGYGNVTLEANLGVVAIGGGVCGPCSQNEYTGTACGGSCLGDEEYKSFEYTLPESNSGRWLLRNVVRARTYGVATTDGAPANFNYKETLSYYDGPAFEGLPLGQADHGQVTRVTQRLNANGDVVTPVRNKLDAHGNVVESLDALGSPNGDEHRHVYAFDDAGLKILRSESLLKDAAGAYSLRQDLQYDSAWDEIIEATNWQVVRGGSTKDPRNSTYYSYDEFGRIVSRTFPGEAAGFTSEEYTYDLGSPKSRIIYQMRSKAGGAFDLGRVLCLDGHGREYQERQRISPDGDTYQVNGFTIFDTKGHMRKVFQPYTGTGAACDLAPPDGTKSNWTIFDAAGRAIRQILPATAQEGADAPFTRRVYRPLATVDYDPENASATSSHANTPTTQRYNGRGALTAVERLLTAGGTPVVHTYQYDELGHVAASTDPAGNRHVEQHDLLGRPVKVVDPDRGTLLLSYDDVGNRLSETDARGVVRRAAFDGANRLLAKWKDGEEAGTRVSYVYDATGHCPASKCTNLAGHLASVTYPLGGGKTGEDRYGWDARGLGIYLGRQVGDRLLEFASEYDDASRLAATTDPTNLRVPMTLDGADRITTIPGYVEALTYEARGALSGMTLKNGVVTTRTHDERQRLSELKVTAKDGSSLLNYAISRDRVGHVIAIADGRKDDGTPLGGARYSLDGLYRLVEARLDPDRPAQSETLIMAYDSLDNITSMISDKGTGSPANVGAYSYGSAAGPRAVAKAGNLAYAYDKAGNMTSRGESAFTWDAFGRLVGVGRDGAPGTSFEYGAEDQRIIRREPTGFTYYLSPNFEVQDGVAVSYVRVDKDRVVERVLPSFAATFLSDLAPAQGADQALTAQPDGTITAADAWLSLQVKSGALQFSAAKELSDVEELLSASAQRMLVGTAEHVRYLHQDQLGSIVAITDENGALAGRMETYPYGTVRYVSGSPSSYGFTGKTHDASTGLIYFGARYLDPVAGRWTAADPLFAMVSPLALEEPSEATAGYGYVGGNPASYYDMRGLKKKASLRAAFNIKATLAHATTRADDFESHHVNSAEGAISAGLSLRWLQAMKKGGSTPDGRMQSLDGAGFNQYEEIATEFHFYGGFRGVTHMFQNDPTGLSRGMAPVAHNWTQPGLHQINVGGHTPSTDYKRLTNEKDPNDRGVSTYNKRGGLFSRAKTHFYDPTTGEHVFNKATAARQITELLNMTYGAGNWDATSTYPLAQVR